MPERLSPALKAVSDAVLAVAAELSVDEVLQRLVDSARELAGARYAALGIPDGAGGFRRFLVAGMSDELIASMGPLPRTHGMLGAMLETREPYLTDDIHGDPRFRGWWPRQHPDMRSFLGVPIVAARRGDRRLLPDREARRRDAFGDGDRELIELLAAHAAIAITNARLYERSRELSILSERNRLALELHDVVSQKLFSLNLAAEAAATLLERDPVAARRAVRSGSGELAREALDELRSLILGLRPADLERDGLDRRAAQGGRDAAPGARRSRSSSTSTRRTPPEIDATATRRSCGSRRRRCTTRVRHAAAAPRHRALSACDGEPVLIESPTTASASIRDDPATALAASGADLDGGARPRARGPARGPLGAGRPAPRSGSS